MLLGLLLPDPCDGNSPEDFEIAARELLPKVQGQVGPKDEDLRKSLLKFIADFANWDLSSDRTYLEISRGLVRAAYSEEIPLVVDPFAGGGSIPLEALRLGCETFASDVNPVACLILKVLLEDISRNGPELAESVRRAGTDIKKQAEKELADLYPEDEDGSKPIAYLWARTVHCESPNCGAEIPIYKSPWLSKKVAKKARFFKETPNGRCRALLISSNPIGGPVEFRIAKGEGSENPRSGFVELLGTKAKGNNANVICPCCGAVLPGNKKNPRVPTQLAAQRGGADVVLDAEGQRIGGARLLAVVTVRAGETGRQYRLPTERDYEGVRKAQAGVAKILGEWEHGGKQGLCPVPDEPLPPIGTLGFRVQRYGMLQWGDLFTSRQKLVLVWLLVAVQRQEFAEIASLLACALNRVTMSDMSCTRWNAVAEKMQHTFGRQALPIVWDFAEVVVTADAPGNWKSGYELIADVIDASRSMHDAQTQAADAAEHPLPDVTANVWFTDPPYYDAVPYADLADFFFVWLKRALPGHPLLRDPFDPTNQLTPKKREVVQDETKRDNGRIKDRLWFEETMAKAFTEGRRVLRPDGIGCVVFAHKTTEGWEALLSGMIRGGWTITGSWPIATEMGSRLRARESAALATSVHLTCRPRPNDAPIGDWGEVLQRELPKRVAEWMERLQAEHVRGADLVFACIGPALEIYSRYSKVVDAEDREIPLGGDPEATEPHKRGYLAYVWEAVGRAALEQVLGTAEATARNGATDALEEDARLTALFLWTLQSTNGEQTVGNGQQATDQHQEDEDEEEEETASKGKKKKGLTLVFDVVRRFAQPLGIHLDNWEDRIIETEKGIVRLLPVGERGTQLFGQDGAELVADRLELQPASIFQLKLFPEKTDAPPKVKGKKTKGKKGSDKDLRTNQEATTLDRVHAAMLLQASGRTNALRALLRAEQERGPDFLRLANALSALYPRESEEKRLLDAMLLAVPR
jgi:adenine-specific DNA methylase